MANLVENSEIWRQVRAVHPGEYVREDVLPRLDISVYDAAVRAKLPVDYMENLVNEKVAVTADAAFGLAELAESTPWLWIDLQTAYDVWHAYRKRYGSPDT